MTKKTKLKTGEAILPNKTLIPGPVGRRMGIAPFATIKEGWNARLFKDGYIVLTHAAHEPRVIELATIREGDDLPRDTDEAVAFPPAVGGH